MKNVLARKVEKCSKKLFTKKNTKGIIKKNYNPSEVNWKIYKRKGEKYIMEDKILESKCKLNLRKLAHERIIKNANVFSEKELSIIKNNSILVEKLYILGILDSI